MQFRTNSGFQGWLGQTTRKLKAPDGDLGPFFSFPGISQSRILGIAFPFVMMSNFGVSYLFQLAMKRAN